MCPVSFDNVSTFGKCRNLTEQTCYKITCGDYNRRHVKLTTLVPEVGSPATSQNVNMFPFSTSVITRCPYTFHFEWMTAIRVYFIILVFCHSLASEGPWWQSGNTLASHLWGRGLIPVTALSGKAGSCLPLVGSLQYTTLVNYMYWFPLPFQLPVVIWPVQCWKRRKTPNKIKLTSLRDHSVSHTTRDGCPQLISNGNHTLLNKNHMKTCEKRYPLIHTRIFWNTKTWKKEQPEQGVMYHFILGHICDTDGPTVNQPGNLSQSLAFSSTKSTTRSIHTDLTQYDRNLSQ